MAKKIQMSDDVKYNRATKMQLFLFSFNNLSTNFPYMILSSYLLFYAQSYLMLSAVIIGWIMTGMRLFDGITDPIVGWLIDRTDTKFGKFRPWMVIGNIIINMTFIVMFALIDPSWSTATKLTVFIVFYFIHIVGYSMQTASTKGGGTVITSDPQQRPVLAFYYGAVGMVVLIGYMSFVPVLAQKFPDNMLDPAFWAVITAVTAGLSFFTMILAVIGIWKKDVKENYQGFSVDKVSLKDFASILRHNRAISMLVIAAATDKLAFSLTGTVTVYFYANVLMNQNLQGLMGLISLPLIFIFIFIATRIGQKVTQKQAFLIMTWASLIFSTICLIFFPEPGSAIASLPVIVFLVSYALRAGTSAVTGTLVTTMVSDCADYETYLSGRAVPGMMGTLFSFVDKMVSSLNGLLVSGMFAAFGLANTQIVPLESATNYSGLEVITLIGLIILPILGYIASIVAMKFYPLDSETMSEIKETIALYKENSEDERLKETLAERSA